MKQFSLLMCAIVFISCTTPEEKQRAKEISAQIKTAEKTIKVIQAGAPDWCESEQGSSCKFLGSYGCLSKQEGREAACMSRFQNSAVRSGGDRVVVTLAKAKLDLPEQTRFNADIYRCTGANVAIHQRLMEIRPNTRLKTHRWVSTEYAEQCNLVSQCNAVSEFKCTTLRRNQTKRCFAYIYKKQFLPEKENVNTLAYERETFADDGAEDQIRLRYTLSGTMYNCPLN